MRRSVTQPWQQRSKSTDDLIEIATIRTFAFSTKIDQVLLYLLRLNEINQTWAKKGFPNLNAWAYARLFRYASHDTLTRLCAVTTKIIAALDAEPMMINGQKVTGLDLLVTAKPSALIRTAGAVGAADEATRPLLVEGLLSGSSDDRKIKAKAGWKPEYGKAQAVWHWEDDEFELRIRGKEVHARIIENNLNWMLENRFTDDDG